ncbi:MAG: FAD-dependent oxidoreductase, partial [Pirellulales bacterium]
RGCPAFLFEHSGEVFYGFPQIDSLGVKVAEHSGGKTIDDPSKTSQQATPGEIAAVERFIGQSLPQVSLRRNRTEVCHYTMSPDHHFLVDRHPRHSNVAFAAGLSGHGFKFATVLGEALVDLACEGGSDLPIGFLGLNRPTL